MLALIAYLVAAPAMELGVVMNIDLMSEANFRKHFQIAEGWASYVRVSVAMDQEGWRPEIVRLPFERNRRLALECKKRGLGMDIHLGGVPHPEDWARLGKPAGAYGGKRYSEMPRSWWPKWAEFQRAAAKAMIDAYGPNAVGKIRFQLFNEPYNRGEDEVVEELMVYLVRRLVDSDGKVFGCPLDGPSLWGGEAQMERQIERFGRFLRANPELDDVIDQVPLSMYPAPSSSGGDPVKLVKDYVQTGLRFAKTASKSLGRPVYFAEAGVGRAYDVPDELFGSRTNELADRALVQALAGFRDGGIQHVTVYQTKDDTEKDAREYGYGLADRFGRIRVDLENLKKLARGEPVALFR